jgi:hypothetical protein
MSSKYEFGRQSLNRNGFTIAQQVFSRADIDNIRLIIAKAKRRAVDEGLYDVDPQFPNLTMLRGDILNIGEMSEVDYAVFDKRVTECAKELIGPNLVYHGDSTVQIGEGARGFHKDNADRNHRAGVDWTGEYGVLRLAIYLQDHAAYSGGLKVRLASHNYFSHHRGRSINLPTSPGDVVFWYLTTSHSGNFVRVRGAPGLCIHPRIERIVPTSLRVPEQLQRMAIFCTLGRAGPHLDHYILYQSERADVRTHWRNCGESTAIDTLARIRGIEIRRPSMDFGITNSMKSQSALKSAASAS